MRVLGPVQVLLPVVMFLALACTPPKAPVSRGQQKDLSAAFAAAVQHEATDPLAAESYLATIDAALSQPDDPWALAALDASLDALLWRRVEAMSGQVDHALVHRTRLGSLHIVNHLRNAYARDVQADAGQLPSSMRVWMRMYLAAGLHSMALRVGDEAASKRWALRSGCVPQAAAVGPLAVHALTALRTPSPLAHDAPFPSSFTGIPPFATQSKPEIIFADACSIDIGATSPLSGMYLGAVDLQNPKDQKLHIAITSGAATRVELGGKLLLERRHALGGQATTSLAVADAPAGRLRLSVRAASAFGGVPVGIRILDERGEPIATTAPRAGDVAPIAPDKTEEVVQAPAEQSTKPNALALAAALARGDTRQANALAESPAAPKPGKGSIAFDLLRIRALQAAHDVARNQRKLRLEGLAEQLLKRCGDCWEAKLVASEALKTRQGYGSGAFAAWQRLGVSAQDKGWTRQLGIMEILWLALDASGQGQADVARSAYDALERRCTGSFMLADLDEQLHNRVGADEVQAACNGGSSRASTRCVSALLATDNLRAALGEMGRLRRLRGDPSLLRSREMFALLARQRRAEALDIYRALSPGERSLATLGAWYGEKPVRDQVSQLLRNTKTMTRDAPYGLQPLARLMGEVPDRAFDFEKLGAQLVARDRAKAFLPGAGTAVLERIEHYDLEPSGLLHFWLYDLRRVSGTTDVAGGTYVGIPMVDGRSVPRTLRRRIHKKDGRVLDPDPRSGGRQGQTDLSQLQPGDYVEVVVEGWGLPRENGQLVVDTADVLPRRTSVRHAEIRLRRPRDVKLSQWTHPRLGKGEQKRDETTVTTVWTLREQPPRTIEGGVPPLESRVALSFGTDSYARIGRSFGEQLRSLQERDPYVKRWVDKAVAGAKTPQEKVERLVEAVGKAIPRGDNFLLSDTSASLAGGQQRDTARTMLERGDGSRSWIIHRGLRELSIDSALVIAETRPFSAAPGFPARPGRFSHALVRATIEGKQVWIDADVEGPPLPPGRISPELRGRKALAADGTLMTVTADAQLDVDDIEVSLTMKPNGDASGRFKALIFGRPAQQLSEALEVVVGERRTSMLRNVVLGWLPWADVRRVELGEDSSSWRLSIRADIAVVGLAQPEDRDGQLSTLAGMQAVHWVQPRAHATSLASVYAQRATRSTPLAINRPLLYRFKRTIVLPAGAKLMRVPKSNKIAHGGIQAERQVQIEGQRIEEVFTLNMPITTVAAADYPAFAGKVRSIDDAFQYSFGVALSETK